MIQKDWDESEQVEMRDEGGIVRVVFFFEERSDSVGETRGGGSCEKKNGVWISVERGRESRVEGWKSPASLSLRRAVRNLAFN